MNIRSVIIYQLSWREPKDIFITILPLRRARGERLVRWTLRRGTMERHSTRAAMVLRRAVRLLATSLDDAGERGFYSEQDHDECWFAF